MYADGKDYERGALDLQSMPYSYLEYLRASESVHAEWKRMQEQQISAQYRARAKVSSGDG